MWPDLMVPPHRSVARVEPRQTFEPFDQRVRSSGSEEAIDPRAALISPEHSLTGFLRYVRVVGPDEML